MDRMFVRPAPGLKVRDPLSLQPLPEHGQFVPVDSHWSRRLADGDVVAADAPVTFDAGDETDTRDVPDTSGEELG